MTQATGASGATLWTAVAVAIAVSLATNEGRSRDDELRLRLAHANEVETLIVPHVDRAAPMRGGTIGVPDPSSVSTGYLRFPDGHIAIPVSEARLEYSKEYLYITVIAADADIRSEGDFFRIVLDDGRKPVEIEVTPDGALAGSGVIAEAKIEGTPNSPGDLDHEWAVSISIPLAQIGLVGRTGERIGFSVTRCNAPDNDCQSFGDPGEGGPSGRLVLGTNK